ncbi:MAG: hypothetical protein LUH23_03780 [Oscillospiraceae bacterium]|nr:hypothetical protein [Oscillospiraceae bacterium]
MRKLFLLFLAVLLACSLCSCGSISPDERTDSHMVSNETNIYNDGEFYYDSYSRLNYFDFTTMQSAVVCPYPNCTHADSSTCSSYGLSCYPSVFDGKMYYFSDDIKYTNGTYAETITVCRCDIDGTNRIAIETFTDWEIADYNPALVVGNTIYMTAKQTTFNDYGSTEDYVSVSLISYDFETNKFSEIVKIGEGYSAGASIKGEADGTIYISYSYYDHELTDEEIDALYTDHIFPESILEYYRFDLSTGEFAENEEAVWKAVDGYLVIYNDNLTEAIIRTPNGEEYDIGNKVALQVCNDYAFHLYYGLLIDLETGVHYESKLPLETGYNVEYYLDGSYILRDSLNNEFIKLEASELIGKETTS